MFYIISTHEWERNTIINIIKDYFPQNNPKDLVIQVFELGKKIVLPKMESILLYEG